MINIIHLSVELHILLYVRYFVIMLTYLYSNLMCVANFLSLQSSDQQYLIVHIQPHVQWNSDCDIFDQHILKTITSVENGYNMQTCNQKIKYMFTVTNCFRVNRLLLLACISINKNVLQLHNCFLTQSAIPMD